jgi:hypothetical protein
MTFSGVTSNNIFEGSFTADVASGVSWVWLIYLSGNSGTDDGTGSALNLYDSTNTLSMSTGGSGLIVAVEGLSVTISRRRKLEVLIPAG